MPHLPMPDIQNAFPDCVAMKLHFKAVETGELGSSLAEDANSNSKACPPTEIDLSLTINFSGQHEMVVPGAQLLGIANGKVAFGVRRGRLQLVLQGCRMLLEGGAASEPSVSNGLELGRSSMEKISFDGLCVQPAGSEATPTWIFEASRGRPILEGVVRRFKLGALQPNASDFGVKAEFWALGEDIRLTWEQMNPAPNVHRNQLAVLERALALQYIGPRCEAGPFSVVSWRYE